MSLRLVKNRVYLQPILNRPSHRAFVRYSSSLQQNDDQNPLKKSLNVTKAYLDKVQAEIKPRLEPYLERMNNASNKIKQLTHDVSDSKDAIRRAGRALNEITGYDQIDTVKQKVNNQASIFESTRDRVQKAKVEYENAIETRSSTQRGINELLQRKHMWTGEDVNKFTELYRLEHEHSQAEQIAKEVYQSSEKQMDREYMELARSIMERYHEEQLWSDKIRSVSTYGTWALMAVNLLLFVAVQTIFEPMKRKRLTNRFEELLISKVDEEEKKFEKVFENMEKKDQLMIQQQLVVMETLNALAEHPLFDVTTLESLKAAPIFTQNETEPMNTTDTSFIAQEPLLEPVLSPIDEQILEDMPLLEHIEEISALPSLDESTLPIEQPETIPLNNEVIPPTSSPVLTPTTNIIQDIPAFNSAARTENTVTLSKTNLALYSAESAIMGGLVTAVAVYFWR
ncbi:hypothetical protein K501DRAFT_235329 [Backusella circina FSU 941]|nr:hypothetical protein K501DRAFT_235329 [Backusella circina FSU 941]